MPTDTVSTTRLTVHIPNDLLDAYEAQAKQAGYEHVEKLLEERLKGCINHSARRGIYFDDNSRIELEQLLQINFVNGSPKKVIEEVKKAVSIRVGGVDVELSPDLVKRLKTRCFHKPFSQFVSETVVRCLEEFVNL